MSERDCVPDEQMQVLANSTHLATRLMFGLQARSSGNFYCSIKNIYTQHSESAIADIGTRGVVLLEHGLDIQWRERKLR